ncbi:MAG TPA: T9SS C-terminal target domain-containing protein [Flavobacterium sp.]|jgi:hypothetical protein
MKYIYFLLTTLVLSCRGSVQILDFQPVKERIYEPELKRETVKAEVSWKLPDTIPEGSGLLAWNNLLWTHNDSGSAKLYALSPQTGEIVANYTLPDVENNDFEDLADDDHFFYVGAIGNNAHQRDTVAIHRILKSDLLLHKFNSESISVIWPETFTQKRQQKINFDCEAMVVVGDSIYLFTKEWEERRRTRIFSVPAKPGIHVAKYKGSMQTNVLITGASYHRATRKLILCGHTLLLAPFLIEFDDVQGTDFFQNPGRKIRLKRMLRQIEGVTTFDGRTYYVINETLRILFKKTPQQLHRVKLTD